MMRVSLEHVSNSVGELYEAACGEKQWSTVIDSISALFDVSKSCLVRQGPDLGPADSMAGDGDLYFTRLYLQEFARNELSDVVEALPPGAVYHDHDLLAPGRLRRTRLWNEWMAPQDMYGGLSCKVLSSGPSSWIFDMQRGSRQEAFGAAETELLQKLTPHFMRAARMARNSQIAGAMSQVFSSLPFGLVILDSSLRVLRANAAAMQELERPASPLRLRHGSLHAAVAAERAMLQRLVAAACGLSAHGLPGTGGDCLVRDRTDAGVATDLILTVAPLADTGNRDLGLEPCAAVYIRRLTLDVPDRFEDYMRLVYRLSPKEARIAARLASGLSLKEAAGEEGIAFSTARTYMEHLFQKTGTHQQSALVALLKSLHPIRHD